MNMDQVIESLRKEAQINSASNAVVHMFALRERARATIVLTSLHNKMVIEGFTFERQDFIPLVRLMASLGLGTLTVDSKGRVLGLHDIKVKLQSLGQAVCGKDVKVIKFKLRNRFRELPQVEFTPEPKKVVSSSEYKINLEVSINGRAVHIPVPKDMSGEDIALLVGRLQAS